MRLRALGGEFIGTALLLAGVVGLGIMAERLSSDIGVVQLVGAVLAWVTVRLLSPTAGP